MHYLLTVRPLSVKRFSNFFELYDMTMNVFNSVIRSVNASVITFRFSDDPYYHIHAVISISGRIRYDHVHKLIPKGFHVHLAPLRKKSDIERAKKYVSRHRPAPCVNVDESVTFINRDGNKNGEVLYMSDLEERLSRLERAVERIVETLETLAKRNRARTQTDNEPQSVNIELGAINVTVQEARKGVALIIKFANYVKQNRNGAYYVALTPEQFNELMNGLQSFNVSETKSNSDDNTQSNSKSGRKSSKRSRTRIKSKRGGEL